MNTKALCDLSDLRGTTSRTPARGGHRLACVHIPSKDERFAGYRQLLLRYDQLRPQYHIRSIPTTRRASASCPRCMYQWSAAYWKQRR